MRSPLSVLAETHRAANHVGQIAPWAEVIEVGTRGWRSRWLEATDLKGAWVVIDDGERLADVLWAIGARHTSTLRVGFLRRFGSPPPGKDTERAVSLLAKSFGWKPVRQRKREAWFFEGARGDVDMNAISVMLPLVRAESSALRSFDGASELRPAVDVETHIGDWGSSGEDSGTRDGNGEDAAAHPLGGVVPVVNLRVVNPIGFSRESSTSLAAVATSPNLSSLSVGQRIDGRNPVRLFDASALITAPIGDPRGDPSELIRSLRPFRAVIDARWLHSGAAPRANVLSWLACAGVPIVATDIDRGLQRVIGEKTAGLMTDASLEALRSEDSRERYSVELRRTAMREVWVSDPLRKSGLWSSRVGPPPTVSVVMATRRPDFLNHALGQLEGQSYPTMEVIVVLHGDDFPESVDSRLAEVESVDLEVIRVSGDMAFGQALNVGISRSNGVIVTKWDDDDWYGRDHIWDLVLALEYSGADLVGKAAEFVYVAELDVTIRRFPEGADTVSRTVAGGTLAAGRDTFQAVGGFPPMPRFVDQGLLARLVDHGGVPFRTHGHGYLLNRHGEHTWSIDTDYFLDASFRQWRGPRLIEAGCAPMVEPAPTAAGEGPS